MMQKIMMNLTLETCGSGFVLCNCDRTFFFFWPSLFYHHLYVITRLNM